MNKVIYDVACFVSKHFLLRLYTRISVTGLENVPLEGPLLIASNHLNDADPGIISTRMPRRVAFMAKVELFGVPLLKHFLVAFGAFPVRRGEADLSALRTANELLKEGMAVVIFPEGTRSAMTARLAEGWPGAAMLALRHDVPILPVAVTGSQRLSLPKMFLHLERRDRVTMTVGKPFHLPRPARLNADSAKEGTRLIMEQIAALLPPSYRGYYGDEAIAARQQAAEVDSTSSSAQTPAS